MDENLTDIEIYDIVFKIIKENYNHLSLESFEDIKSCSVIKKFEKNTIFIKEGQVSENLFLIIKGSVCIYYLKEDKKITDWIAFENYFVSAINSYFLGIPSPHYLETIEHTYLMQISKTDLNILCDKHHDIERMCRIISNKTMFLLQQRIVSLQFETAMQRYINLIEFRPDILQRIPLGYIASFLGITMETLSRIRNSYLKNKQK